MSGPTLRNRLGNLRRTVLAPLHLRTSEAELLSTVARDLTPDRFWAVTQAYQGKGWFRFLTAWQVEEEYTRLVSWVAQQRPRVILEIGTFRGGTLFAWSRIATRLVVSIDLPGGIHGGGYPPAKQRLYRRLTRDRPGVEMLIYQADSQSAKTFNQVKAALSGQKIDFLFIDGDHRYDGVKRDFELWTPLVAAGGHVGFHDILRNHEGHNCEVDRFWSELKNRFSHFEIVADRNQGWAGVGVVRMPIEE